MTADKNNRIETSEKQEQKAPWSAPQLVSLDADDTHSGKPAMSLIEENFPYGSPS